MNCIYVLVWGVVGLGSAASAIGQATAPPAAKTESASPQTKISDEQIRQLRSDWPNLMRFHDEDVALPAPAAGEKRVVFMGDSITEAWLHNGVPKGEAGSEFFPGKPYVNRGISGQTTPQMLIRFRPDVIALKPSAVVILAGINDIAGNTGEMTLEQTEGNLASMAELAHANGIKVVMCSILPAFDIPWRPGREAATKVVAVNTWMKNYAAAHRHTYVDFYTAMVDGRGGLPTTLSHDGVHPTKAGYDIMIPLALDGIDKALGSR